MQVHFGIAIASLYVFNIQQVGVGPKGYGTYKNLYTPVTGYQTVYKLSIGFDAWKLYTTFKPGM